METIYHEKGRSVRPVRTGFGMIIEKRVKNNWIPIMIDLSLRDAIGILFQLSEIEGSYRMVENENL